MMTGLLPSAGQTDPNFNFGQNHDSDTAGEKQSLSLFSAQNFSLGH